MASIRKRGDSWVAEVFKRGVRMSRSFATKQAAQAWARATESEIDAGNRPSSVTVGQMLDKYGREVSSTKRGSAWELKRIAAFQRLRIAQEPLSSVDATHIAKWRDERLQSVSSGTVLREWTLLSHAFSIAIREWRSYCGWPRRGSSKGVRPQKLTARCSPASSHLPDLSELDLQPGKQRPRVQLAGHTSTARCSGISSQPSWAPLAW